MTQDEGVVLTATRGDRADPRGTAGRTAVLQHPQLVTQDKTGRAGSKQLQ